MKLTRLLAILVIFFVAISWFPETAFWKKTKAHNLPLNQTSVKIDKKYTEKLKEKIIAARKFVLQKGYNSKTCLFIDMSLPSGKNRFFIYNLAKDTLEAAALVAHGNCFEYWLEGRRYSNVVGSGCTSLGKYKIGSSYTGKFGYSYKLHGLDSTNTNALERTVVLHAHSCIPETEVNDEICQSNGCPTVAPNFLNQLKLIINNSKKPVLLWIFD
jgi:L,D-transpeptidase catalytic domain